MTDIRQTSDEQATIKDVRFSDLMEDLVGFGARTFHSITTAFTDPRTYFLAAKSPDWTGRFSPSVRIYLGLITVSAFFRFLYAGEAGAMTTLYEGIFEDLFDQVEAQGKERPTASTTDLAMETLRYYFILSPFIALPIYMLIGWMFRSFGEPLNAVVRIRYVFAAMVPATTVMTLLTIGFVILPQAWFSTLSLATMMLTHGFHQRMPAHGSPNPPLGGGT